MLSDLINLNFGRISGGKHLHICVIGLIMQGPKKSFKRPKNHIFDHLEQMIYYTRPPWRRRLTIEPHQSSKENTHKKRSCCHFSLWNVQFWPQLDRVLPGWWSMSVCFGSVCDIGFYQVLRLTICFQSLPLRISESNQSTSCCSMNVCVSCLTSVAWLTTQIFSFQPETLGKHWPKRNNLRVKAQSFKKRRQQGGIS